MYKVLQITYQSLENRTFQPKRKLAVVFLSFSRYAKPISTRKWEKSDFLSFSGSQNELSAR